VASGGSVPMVTGLQGLQALELAEKIQRRINDAMNRNEKGQGAA